MAVVGLYGIAATFVGMAVQLFLLASRPTTIDVALSSGHGAEVSERAISRLRTRRLAARSVGSLLLLTGVAIGVAATRSWL